MKVTALSLGSDVEEGGPEAQPPGCNLEEAHPPAPSRYLGSERLLYEQHKHRLKI